MGVWLASNIMSCLKWSVKIAPTCTTLRFLWVKFTMQARIKKIYLYWVDIRHEIQWKSQTQILTNNIVVTNTGNHQTLFNDRIYFIFNYRSRMFCVQAISPMPIRGNFYHMVFLSGGGGEEIHGGGGVPCDTGFNSPTEKVAENIVIWEILDWVHIIFKSLYVFYINISKH